MDDPLSSDKAFRNWPDITAETIHNQLHFYFVTDDNSEIFAGYPVLRLITVAIYGSGVNLPYKGWWRQDWCLHVLVGHQGQGPFCLCYRPNLAWFGRLDIELMRVEHVYPRHKWVKKNFIRVKPVPTRLLGTCTGPNCTDIYRQTDERKFLFYALLGCYCLWSKNGV